MTPGRYGRDVSGCGETIRKRVQNTRPSDPGPVEHQRLASRPSYPCQAPPEANREAFEAGQFWPRLTDPQKQRVGSALRVALPLSKIIHHPSASLRAGSDTEDTES